MRFVPDGGEFRHGLAAYSLIVLACLLWPGGAFAQSAVGVVSGRYAIIPRPVSLKAESGDFTLKFNTRLVVNGSAAAEVARYFRRFVRPATGYSLKIITDEALKRNAINLMLVRGFGSRAAYTLSVSRQRVVIEASGAAGLFYGLQSLRQMLPPQIESRNAVNDVKWRVACVQIYDEPRYRYRGMLLDVSRHFFSKAFIERFLDVMALYKMNVFHWHLTDDQGWRLQIKKYPKLISVGSKRSETAIGGPFDRVTYFDGIPVNGYYSESDVRQIVHYAKVRHITIVPEIDVPGHASALLAAYPQYGCIKKTYRVKRTFGKFDNVLCPTEKTFAFLENLFTEVASEFPGPFIHIGGDEVKTNQWKACSSCRVLMRRNGWRHYSALQSYFDRRVDKIIAGLHRKAIGWEGVLKGGTVPSNVTVEVWLHPGAVRKAIRSGHDVIISLSNRLYFNQYESLDLDEPMASNWQPPISLKDVYDYHIVPPELSSAQAGHVLGAEAAVWTNYINTGRGVEHAALPRMAALAEILWSPRDRRSWSSFLGRMKVQFKRMSAMGVDASHAVYGVSARHAVKGRGVRLALYTHGAQHVIRYTVDGTKPTIHARVYRKPLLLLKPTTVRAVGEDARTGAMYGDFRMTVVPNKALGKPVRFLQKPMRLYKPGPEKTLVDGIVSYNRIFHPMEWAQFDGDNCDAVIDFGKAERFHSVAFGYDAGMYAWLPSPQAVKILVSNSGKSWRLVKEVGRDQIVQHRPFLRIKFPSVTARYLRFIAVNHRKNTSIYIDELTVN